MLVLAVLAGVVAASPYRAAIIMVGAWAIGIRALARRSPLPEQWGAWAVVAFYTLVAVGGYVGATVSLPYGSLGFSTDNISRHEYVESAVALLGVAGFFALGAAIGWRKTPTVGPRSRGRRELDPLVGELKPEQVAALGLAILAIGIMGYGPSSLLAREAYGTSTAEYRYLVILADTVGPLLVFVMWALAGVGQSRRLSMVAAAFSATFGAFYLARASRFLAAMIMLSGVGYLLGSWSKRRTATNLAYLVVLAVVSGTGLLLPLYLRGNENHGLLPYVESLATSGIVGVRYSGELDAATLTANVLSGIAVTSESSHLQVDWSHLVVQLNPLPGALVGWYDIADVYRLSPISPANTPGTLLAFGMPVAAVAYLAAGYVMARMARWAQGLPAWNFLVSNALALLSALFAVVSLQYSLRSSFRYIWYGVGVTCAAVALKRLRYGRPAGVRYRTIARVAALRARGGGGA